LSLKATQPGRNAREGTAQIATGPANPLTYIAGALLANGTSLVEVHSDHVVLRRGEVSTTLYLETMAGKKPVHEELLEVTAPPPPTRKIEQSLQPETYASIVRAAPRFADNKVIGFEVYGGTNPGAMYQLGLQPGDVLLELDGRAVSSVEQLHRGLRSIKGGAAVLATVLRGTEQVVLSLDGTKLVGSPSPSPLAGGPGP
jgi:type II secretory pathway component PulC